jgi:hypothetical protein
MCFFKKDKHTIQLKKGESAIIFGKDGFSGFIDPQGAEDGTATYMATLVTWLLMSDDSDAKLLYQAVSRKLDEKLEIFKRGQQLKEARNGTSGTDNRI